MWHVVRKAVSERKSRRFALACASRAAACGNTIPDAVRELLELIDGISDGTGVIPDEYYELARKVYEITTNERQSKGIRALVKSGDRWLCSSTGVSDVIHDAAGAGELADVEYQHQADLLRCVVASPFRPVAFNPAWTTSTVVALAQGMYAERDFSAMPILADALQDAGCDNDDILNHCRGAGPHVRGCWVVDGILGKS